MKLLPVVVAFMATVTLSSCSALSPNRLSDGAICAQINSRFYYPRVPPGGVSVSRGSALAVEKLLDQARSSALRDEITPLGDAIAAHNEAEMVRVFSSLTIMICPTLGVTPPT
jgi:hypothetical protein